MPLWWAVCNPLDLTLREWGACLLGAQLGLAALDGLTMRCVATRRHVGARGSHVWTRADTARVVANMFIAQIFLMQCAHLVRQWPSGEAAAVVPATVRAVRTIIGVYALFYVDDWLYTPLHRWMHTRPAYHWIHAAHHAQSTPHRGCWDAVNESAAEQSAALLLHLLAIRAVHATVGLTRWAVGVHLVLKSVGSCLNHVDASCCVSLGAGVRFDPAYHRAHHSTRQIHFAQFVPACDTFWEHVAQVRPAQRCRKSTAASSTRTACSIITPCGAASPSLRTSGTSSPRCASPERSRTR